jgi:SOS-response transcriptional repressor LexA
MRITENILAALRQAVINSGDAKEFAAKTGISASNISRYLSGKVKSVTDECWEKLEPALDLTPPTGRDTVANTPELRKFIRNGMDKMNMKTPEQLRRAIGYTSSRSLQRIFDGELNWFPDVLSAVFDILELDPDSSPLSKEELSLLAPSGFYRDGAMLIRPVPVVEWANAASHLESLISDSVVMGKWDVENTPSVPVPADARKDTKAFKVHGISMEPRILDDDIVLVEPAETPELIPDNKVVVVRFNDDAPMDEKVVCKRLRKQSNGTFLLTSDNPEGKIIPFTCADVSWIGVVVKKISEM